MTDSIKQRRDLRAQETVRKYFDMVDNKSFHYGFNAGLTDEVVKAMAEALGVVSTNGEGRGMGWTPAQHARLAIEAYEQAVREIAE